MLYTRKGDDGTSSFYCSQGRTSKDSELFEALGTVDELNSLLGVCVAKAVAQGARFSSIVDSLRTVQNDLFIVQAELAGADKTISAEHVVTMERTIEELEKHIENPHAFVVSGATELSAFLDYARAVSRRAERAVIRSRHLCAVSAETLQYLNRLSSLLYVLARVAATEAGVAEVSPTY